MNYTYSQYKNLPKALDKNVQLEYFKRLRNGDVSVRNILIEHNMKLVFSSVIKKFSLTSHDMEDLVSIGVIGLIKAVDTYNYEKNASFGTYATRCIDNEILMSLRVGKNKKSVIKVSLDDPFLDDHEGGTLLIKDFVSDDNVDIENDYIKSVNLREVRSEVDNIENEMYRKIMYMFYGFEGDPMTQREVANALGLSQSYVSRVLRKENKKILENLISNGFILPEEAKNVEFKKTARRFKTLYDYISYDHNIINDAIDKLSDEDKRDIEIIWGLDLENSSINSSDPNYEAAYYRFLNYILPRIKSLLFTMETNKTLKLD